MKFNHRLNTHVQAFLELKKTERIWHFPFLAGMCVGLCLFVGWYFDRPAYGNLSSIGALVILYFTNASIPKRMIHLCVCAFAMPMGADSVPNLIMLLGAGWWAFPPRTGLRCCAIARTKALSTSATFILPTTPRTAAGSSGTARCIWRRPMAVIKSRTETALSLAAFACRTGSIGELSPPGALLRSGF